MDKSEVKEVLRELNIATDFRISLHDITSDEICASPAEIRRFCSKIQEDPDERERCQKCDSVACQKALISGETYSYKCRFGLTESVSPIYNFNKHVGFLMMGQTFEVDEDRALADKKLAELGIKEKERQEILSEIPTVGRALSESFAKILTICAKYLTLCGAVHGTEETLPQSAMRYIKEHYSEKIPLKDICAKLGCSKTTLISAFKEAYSITVNSAVTETRLEAARKHLSSSPDASVNDVALACGFSDQSYFCKVFSAKYGESPSEYRRSLSGKK